MKIFINHLFEQKETQLQKIELCKVKIQKLNAVVQAFQEYCPHKHPDGTDAMKFRGNDSHRHFYKCEICRLEMEE